MPTTKTTSGSGREAYRTLELERVRGAAAEAYEQAQATWMGAANILPYDFSNRFNAATIASLYPDKTWKERYVDVLAAQHARDAYNAERRALATQTGQAAGTVAALALTRGAVKAPPVRIAGAAGLSVPEAVALPVVGGGTGVVMQNAADLATGRRTSVGDNIGAFVGGAVGAAGLPFTNPVAAAGAGGWTTSAVQDLMNNRPISLDDAARSAVAARVLGRVGDKVGIVRTNQLPMRDKGRLGEAMGSIRSLVNLQPRKLGPKKAETVPNSGGKKIVPDGRHRDILFEDKFGNRARLRPNQTRARRELGDKFRVYHFTPDDVGRALSLPFAIAGSHLAPAIEAAPGLLAAMIRSGQDTTPTTRGKGR